MHGFLRRLKAAWDYGKFFPYIPEADEAWSDEDASACRAFFTSTVSGQRLSMRLRNTVIRASMQAVQRQDGQHAAGIAAGMAMTVATIESHFPQGETQEEEKAA